MIEFEFDELIFNLCKKYISLKYLKGYYSEYNEIVSEVETIVNKLEKPKNNRKKYSGGIFMFGSNDKNKMYIIH